MFHSGSREFQDRFGTRSMADRIVGRLAHDRFTPDDREFIARMDMFFLATADEHGRPTCSYKGGDPGFVRVLDDRTLAFPCQDGNGMFLSFGNVLRNPQVGLLFVDFEHAWRMRVDGAARIDLDDPLLAAWPEAQFVVRVTPRAIYPNCPRYIHRMRLVERSPYVPHRDVETPVPDWKRAAWVRDVLPPHDAARTQSSGPPDRDRVHGAGEEGSGAMETISRLEKRTFEAPDDSRTPFPLGRTDVVILGGLTLHRETLQPGWRWSEHVRPVAGTNTCEKYHVKVILSGRQHVVMADGTDMVLGPGDVAVIPPGHDAWVEGDEPNVLLELAQLVPQGG